MSFTMKKYLVATALVVALSLTSDAALSAGYPGPVDSAWLPSFAAYPPYVMPERYRLTFELESMASGVPLWIAARMAEYESGFDERAVNRANSNGTADYGLMQLNSAYLDEFSWRYNGGQEIDPFDPQVSVRVALRHLSRLYRSTGDWPMSVGAYNAGLTRVLTQGYPRKTRAYIRFVFRELVRGKGESAWIIE